jgi:membrane associated rhomboid family serine protease
VSVPQPQRRYDSPWPPSGGPPLSRLRYWSITNWLIAINVAIFVIDIIGKGWLMSWGYFSYEKAIRHVQLWRFITFQFLHADVGHLFFNMFSLYFFGNLVEGRLGRKRYLPFYLICGTAGALAYLGLWRIGLVLGSSESPMIGASAGVFGVLIAAVKIAPDMRVQMIFPPVTLRMTTLAWIFIGFAVLTIISKGQNAGGEAAHLGGAFVGWLLMSNHGWLNVFDRKRRGRRFWRPGDPAEKFFRREDE